MALLCIATSEKEIWRQSFGGKRVALFLCQAREHGRQVPQERCPPSWGIGRGLRIRTCSQGRWWDKSSEGLIFFFLLQKISKGPQLASELSNWVCSPQVINWWPSSWNEECYGEMLQEGVEEKMPDAGYSLHKGYSYIKSESDEGINCEGQI